MTDASPATRPVRLGLLYPGTAAEDDYDLLAARAGPDVTAEVVRTSVGEDAHRIDALLDLGGPQRLREGAQTLRERNIDAVIWACTSGSFVFGWQGAREQADALGEELDVPASSTSFAFVAAARHLGVTRVAVAASYPAEVARSFVDFLGEAGIEVVRLGSAGIVTAEEVGTLGRDAVLELVRGGDHPDAEAVLVPDTAMHTAAWLDDMEQAIGKPVLTANQVTLWHALSLTGREPSAEGLGALFAPAHV